jgi:hypothetical protein
MPSYPDPTRLVDKAVALGTIRALGVPEGHIGLEYAPFLEVPSDDVILQYAVPLIDGGLAPARAEDAESELAQKDYTFGQEARASIMDWALKDRYSASDVTRWQESNLLAAAAGGNIVLPRDVVAARQEFNDKVARDDARRRRKLDNRIEWMIMTSLALGVLAYNDGKIAFNVNWGRPSDQHNQAPASGQWITANKATTDPVGDIMAMQDFMFNRYGVRMTRSLGSKKAYNAVLQSDRWMGMAGLVAPTGGTFPLDPKYVINGYGPQWARARTSELTGMDMREYDSVYRTRPVNSNTITSNRFIADNIIIFFPDPADVAAIDDTAIGFAKTLTSPHPEGNWTAGYYEWEETTRDPWQTTRGTGIKAFPVFPHMDLTYVMQVIP